MLRVQTWSILLRLFERKWKIKEEIGIRVRGVQPQERGNKNLLLLHLLFVLFCTVHRWQNNRCSRSLSCNSNLYFYLHPKHSLYLLEYNQPECLPQSLLLTQLQILQLFLFDSLPRLEYEQY
jgi:isoprenylcysteine carboxyl methyltransferase (ICMT) family protein YpbQ